MNTIKILNKDMQHCKTNIKVYKTGDNNNITVAQLYKEFATFAQNQEKNWAEQRKFNAEQTKFNQFVLNMFKKHKWI